MQFQTKKKRKALINVTSLIDVLFLLLIFLMISSTFLEQPGIKLELPSAQSVQMVEQKEFTLLLKKDGKIFLNEIEVKVENLEDELKQSLAEVKGKTLILKADRDVSHGLVVQLMDIAKRSGITKLVIATKFE